MKVAADIAILLKLFRPANYIRARKSFRVFFGWMLLYLWHAIRRRKVTFLQNFLRHAFFMKEMQEIKVLF